MAKVCNSVLKKQKIATQRISKQRFAPIQSEQLRNLKNTNSPWTSCFMFPLTTYGLKKIPYWVIKAWLMKIYYEFQNPNIFFRKTEIHRLISFLIRKFWKNLYTDNWQACWQRGIGMVMVPKSIATCMTWTIWVYQKIKIKGHRTISTWFQKHNKMNLFNYLHMVGVVEV